MSYCDEYNRNCPLFIIGCCKKDDKNPCMYRYHKVCNNNFLCDNPKCEYGHGISINKREIIYNINRFKAKNSYYASYKEYRCKMSMNCTKES